MSGNSRDSQFAEPLIDEQIDEQEVGPQCRVVKILIAMAVPLCCLGYVMLAKTETMIATDEAPVSLMSGDYWTPWTDGNQRGKRNVLLVCSGSSFVSSLQFKEQSGYGIVDAKISCSDNSMQSSEETGNGNGVWNQDIPCKTGFKKLVAEEQSGYGLINFKGYCSSTYDDSNGNEHGGWVGMMDCNDDVIAGIQTREQGGYGIINIRVLCRRKRRVVKHIQVLLMELLAVSGGSAGYIDRKVTSNQGSKSTRSISSEMRSSLKTKIDASVKYEEFSASSSVESGIETAVKSAASQEEASFHEETETIHIDLSRPCYVYQASITTTFDDGTVLVQKGVTTTLTEQVQNPYQKII